MNNNTTGAFIMLNSQKHSNSMCTNTANKFLISRGYTKCISEEKKVPRFVNNAKYTERFSGEVVSKVSKCKCYYFSFFLKWLFEVKKNSNFRGSTSLNYHQSKPSFRCKQFLNINLNSVNI